MYISPKPEERDFARTANEFFQLQGEGAARRSHEYLQARLQATPHTRARRGSKAPAQNVAHPHPSEDMVYASVSMVSGPLWE
jgi:hypothetical protein